MGCLSLDYSFGYNGMEKDPEMKGDGNSYTTEFRQYDPRLGRWLSLDPMKQQFPEMSPYVAFANNPIYYNDPLGLEPGDGDKPSGGSEGDKHTDCSGKTWTHMGSENGGWRKDTNMPEVIVIAKLKMPSTTSSFTGGIVTNSIEQQGFWDAVSNANSMGIHDLFFGSGEGNYDNSIDQASYLRGQSQGYLFASAQAALEITAGGGVAGGGLATGPGALVISSAGVVMIAHGEGVLATATANEIIVLAKLAKITIMNMESGTESSSDENGDYEDASGGEVQPSESREYITVKKGDKTYHIGEKRVKEWKKNPRNPHNPRGDQVSFKKGTPKGSYKLRGSKSGNNQKRTPTPAELEMWEKYRKK